MNKFKRVSILAMAAFSQVCASDFDEINLMIDQDTLVQVQPEDTFEDVIGMISRHVSLLNDESQDFRIEFAVSGSVVNAKAIQVANVARDYAVTPTTKEQEDIRYILKTLANSSLLKIGATESTLKKAGERIDHLHPLRFLEFVFTDEELKVCMHNLQGRSWVWKEFTSGLIGSLTEEYNRGNIKPEYVANFAKTVKLSINTINPAIQGQRWGELLDILITKIPREKGSDRYNM